MLYMIGGAVSVEDQLRLAVANRRKLIERREPSTSDSDSRSHSVTPGMYSQCLRVSVSSNVSTTLSLDHASPCITPTQ